MGADDVGSRGCVAADPLWPAQARAAGTGDATGRAGSGRDHGAAVRAWDLSRHGGAGGGALSKRRLVIIEGIMGSGKSNTALNLAERLGKAGLPAEAVTEGSDQHPVRGTDGLEHWHKPWLDITPPELAERCLAKWRGYIQGALATETPCILDGQFFHGDFTNLFLMDAGTEALEKYCKALEEIIKPLEPLLVYFHQDDFGRTIRDVSAERGEKWVRYQLDWKLQTPY